MKEKKVLEIIALAIIKLLEDRDNISTRVEEMLGHIRKVTTLFKHIPDKKRKRAKRAEKLMFRPKKEVAFFYTRGPPFVK